MRAFKFRSLFTYLMHLEFYRVISNAYLSWFDFYLLSTKIKLFISRNSDASPLDCLIYVYQIPVKSKSRRFYRKNRGISSRSFTKI